MMQSQTKTIIIDSGTAFTKAGLSSCDTLTPRIIIQSSLEKKHQKNVTASNAHSRFIHNQDPFLESPFENGIITNWDVMQSLWQHTFDKLNIIPYGYNVVLTEKYFNLASNRSKTMEIMFEKFSLSSLYIGLQSIFSLYASGRTTGLVLNCGNEMTYCVAMNRGFVLSDRNSIQNVSFGGKDLTKYIDGLFSERGYTFTTRAEKKIVADVKEKLCYVAKDFEKEVEDAWHAVCLICLLLVLLF